MPSPITPILESMKTDEKMHTPETEIKTVLLHVAFPGLYTGKPSDEEIRVEAREALAKFEKLERQRDELLAALKNIIGDVVGMGEMCTQSLVRTSLLDKAKSVVAKCETK